MSRSGWARRTGGSLALLLGLVGSACGRKEAPPPAPPPFPEGVAAASSSAPVASASAPPAPAEPPFVIADALLTPILADPRLAKVEDARLAGEPTAAAEALRDAIARAKPAPPDAVRWHYQLARLEAAAGHPDRAHDAYKAAGSEAWPLQARALCLAASQANALGRFADAEKLADGPPDKTCALARAEALAGQGKHEAAVKLWETELPSLSKGEAHAVRVKLATSLLSLGQNERAFALATEVWREAPAGAAAREAKSVRDKADQALRKVGKPPKTTWDDELTRLSGLLDAGKLGDVGEGVEKLRASLPEAQKKGELGCKLELLTGKLLVRKKQRKDAADVFGEAKRLCKDEALVQALWQGGNASLSAKRPDEALSRFEELEKIAPKHRLADDARVKGAEAARELGDMARFSKMLLEIADAYPEGDMVTEGLFQLALDRIQKGDWGGAARPLELSLKHKPEERDVYRAGRAGYFQARMLAETGDKERAKAGYAKVMKDAPLGYFMVLAHARLAELDPALAKATLEEAQKAAGAELVLRDHPDLHGEVFGRALELLRQGDVEAARREIATLSLGEELHWTLAAVYARAGAHAVAHALPKGKLVDWLAHYPSGSWRRAWEIAYPRPFSPVVEREAKKSGIPTSFAYAIMREESAFDPHAVSKSNAIGLMQLILPTAKTMAKKVGIPVSEGALKVPATNVALGCRYLGDLRKTWSAMPLLAIPSYNAGPGAPRRWLRERPLVPFDVFVETIPYEETRQYTKRVIKSYAAYLWLYEPAMLGEVLTIPVRAAGETQPQLPDEPEGPPAPLDAPSEAFE